MHKNTYTLHYISFSILHTLFYSIEKKKYSILHINKKMVQIRAKQVRAKVKNLKKIIKKYKKSHPQKERDYKEYEKKFSKRLKKAVTNLENLIKESVRKVGILRRQGNKTSVSLEKRIKILLTKELSEKGNRKMANLLGLFSKMGGTDISYKTVERFYSDDEIKMVLMNLFILCLKKRNVLEIDCCGDATGYALTITKHYSSYIKKLKDKGKIQKQNCKKRSFVYKFAIMDLETKMYVCYGSSLKSEKQAFNKAIQMLENIDVKLKTIRLDRYYSCPVYVNLFKGTFVYIIPKKNAELGNGLKWNDTLKAFVVDTMKYLEEYFKRNNSESGFASDKKMFGWKVSQKREDLIDTALFARAVWHNILLLYA